MDFESENCAEADEMPVTRPLVRREALLPASPNTRPATAKTERYRAGDIVRVRVENQDARNGG